jgi:hypothetical protein
MKSVKVLVVIMTMLACHVAADGSAIDKVYHPYVQLLETEIEYRAQVEDDGGNNTTVHRLGLGGSLSDQMFAEIYLIGEESRENDFNLEALELELKLQLTEQGEYANDWGLIFEFEWEKNESAREFAVALIALHEWSNWIGTVNLSAGYEWGSDVDNEFESSLAAQLRYRYRAELEPAFEVYLGEGTQGAGPVLTGTQRLGGRKKLAWEFGVIWGLDDETADTTWKANIEYEF